MKEIKILLESAVLSYSIKELGKKSYIETTAVTH